MIINPRPVLVNETGAWTIHEYHHSEPATIDQDGVPVSGIAHMFRCTATGALKRYGFDRHSAQGVVDPHRVRMAQ